SVGARRRARASLLSLLFLFPLLAPGRQRAPAPPVGYLPGFTRPGSVPRTLAVPGRPGPPPSQGYASFPRVQLGAGNSAWAMVEAVLGRGTASLSQFRNWQCGKRDLAGVGTHRHGC